MSKYGKWLAELSAIWMLLFRTLVAFPQWLQSNGSQSTVSCSKPTSVNSAAWKSKISWTLTCSKSGNLCYNYTGWHEDIPYFALLVGKSLEVTNFLRCKLLSAFIRIVNFNSSMDLSMFAVESVHHMISSIHWHVQRSSCLLHPRYCEIKSGVSLLLNTMTIPWSGGCRSMVVFWGR